MTAPAGLRPSDLAAVMEQFGVAEAQVRRDHAISHLLGVLSRLHRDDVTFFGGTALSRTYLLDERLSEDIDLIATVDRDGLAELLVREIDAALARTHGRVTWSPGWTQSDVAAAVALLPGGIAIKIQLLRAEGYEPWPTEFRAIEQRYGDAPPATLRVPTLRSFAAWKTAAWMDRGAARDLYDLWALNRVGALTTEAAALFARHGPTGKPPRFWMFGQSPPEPEWRIQLGAQTRLRISAAEALAAVRAGWAAALDEEWPR